MLLLLSSQLRSMSTVGNFGESSVPLSNLPRGTTQRFYSVYADSPEGEVRRAAAQSHPIRAAISVGKWRPCI